MPCENMPISQGPRNEAAPSGRTCIFTFGFFTLSDSKLDIFCLFVAPLTVVIDGINTFLWPETRRIWLTGMSAEPSHSLVISLFLELNVECCTSKRQNENRVQVLRN